MVSRLCFWLAVLTASTYLAFGNDDCKKENDDMNSFSDEISNTTYTDSETLKDKLGPQTVKQYCKASMTYMDCLRKTEKNKMFTGDTTFAELCPEHTGYYNPVNAAFQLPQNPLVQIVVVITIFIIL